MSSSDAPYAVYTVLAIALVASSLIGMRLSIGKAAKMALAWVAIFAVVFALFTFKSDFALFGERLYASAFGEPVETAGGELRIPMGEDGHFWIRGKVNGQSARFLVDSGASVTTLSAETAAEAGITPSNRRRMVETANGRIIVFQGVVERFAIGSIERTDFTVNVSDRDGTDILGMNFLSSLDGWRVERNELILRP